MFSDDYNSTQYLTEYLLNDINFIYINKYIVSKKIDKFIY